MRAGAAIGTAVGIGAAGATCTVGAGVGTNVGEATGAPIRSTIDGGGGPSTGTGAGVDEIAWARTRNTTDGAIENDSRSSGIHLELPGTAQLVLFVPREGKTIFESTVPPPDGPGTPPGSGRDQTSQNIETVLDFYTREERKMSRPQRILERISHLVGQPVFLGFILAFVSLWIVANVGLRGMGIVPFDPAPFFWLQGMVGLGALLTATAVLSRQNRLARLEEQRAHLDLKVTLLTEQKAAKLIDLLEELRRDLPNVGDRHDPEATALKQSMNPDLVLAALDERSEPESLAKS